jgi:hypothetical protein
VFSWPRFQTGTRWHYRTDSATNQGCWYIKELGASSGEAATSGPSVTPKRYNESTAPRQRQRSKWGQDLQKAIEAIGDKDVVIAPTDRQEDWQQALYEEFLRWRLWQLIPQ